MKGFQPATFIQPGSIFLRPILEEMKRLQDVTMGIKDNMEEMNAGAVKVSEAGTILTDVSGKIETSIKHIGNQIDQFTV